MDKEVEKELKYLRQDTERLKHDLSKLESLVKDQIRTIWKYIGDMNKAKEVNKNG